MAMVNFNPDRSVSYIRVGELDNNDCDSGLCDASNEESVRFLNNEESGDKWSDTGEDENGNFMLTCLLMWFVSCSLLVFAFNKDQLNGFNGKMILLFFSSTLLLPIIIIAFLICKARKRRRTFYWA